MQTLSVLHTESPHDYRAVPQLVTVPQCEAVKCETIVIVDDPTLEYTETFGITLNRTTGLDPRIRLYPSADSVLITVTDNDSMFFNGI